MESRPRPELVEGRPAGSKRASTSSARGWRAGQQRRFVCNSGSILSLGVSGVADLAGEKIVHRWCGHVPRDEGFADAARQDQGQPALAHLLVLTHDLEEGCGIRRL